MKLRAGDWVEVRSREEILRSLDENGRLEGLPFMPQMFQYRGQRFFEVDFTSAGNPRVDVRSKDHHGDLVIATALALWFGGRQAVWEDQGRQGGGCGHRCGSTLSQGLC
jgi:hypothetical protein